MERHSPKKKKSRKKLKNEGASCRKQSSNKAQWKERIQYFGVNDRFEKEEKKKRVSQASRNIDQAVDNWTLENGYQRALCTTVLAGASHNFVKAKKQAENSQAV